MPTISRKSLAFLVAYSRDYAGCRNKALEAAIAEGRKALEATRPRFATAAPGEYPYTQFVEGADGSAERGGSSRHVSDCRPDA
jgi:hypothetical protein